MARSVDDARLMFAALAGPTEPDARLTTALTFGIPQGYLLERLDADVRRTYHRVQDSLTRAGHRLVDVRIATARSTPDIYLHIVLAESAEYHAPLLERHADKYSPVQQLPSPQGIRSV